MKTLVFSAYKNCSAIEMHLYLFMYLLCRLCITESHSGQIFEDWHLHSAVTPIQQRHQGARVHRPIHNLGPNTCRETRREERKLIIYVWHKQSEGAAERSNVGNTPDSRSVYTGWDCDPHLRTHTTTHIQTPECV